MTSKPRMRIRPLTANVVPAAPSSALLSALFGDGRLVDAIPVETALAPAWRTQGPSGNPAAFLYEA